MQKREWSPFQREIFRDIQSGSGNTIIIARAGASKTTVLVEGAKYVPRGKKLLFCAFNKSIQEELRNRLGDFIDCFTLHSLGFRAVKQRFPSIELNNNKCWEIVEKFFDDPKECYDLIHNICKTVSLCKATITDAPSKIEDLICEYGIDTCDQEMGPFIKFVSKTLAACKANTNQLDFDDMVWFPLIFGLKCGNYDVVFIDEAHDMSRSMIELALSAVKRDGRVIAVLDDRQAIYAFRGADAKVLDNLRTRLAPKELMLPICYRCPKKVISLAQTIVPDIQVYEHNQEGEIIEIALSELDQHIKVGSYLISRTNAPLVAQCLKLLKNKIPTNILGRDIGDGLLSLIKRSKKKRVDAFLKWLSDWGVKERLRILAVKPRANVDFIADKIECLRYLCEGAASLEEVKSNIKALFKDVEEKNIVLGSSIHRIKGKESDTVFVLADTLWSSDIIEKNCEYVAYTRARKKLYLVRKHKKEDTDETEH
jgi:DNA helicase II / ATP-dependent DNA helicase PcrA